MLVLKHEFGCIVRRYSEQEGACDNSQQCDLYATAVFRAVRYLRRLQGALLDRVGVRLRG